ncbi:hypothetical protein [Eubacterium barkeri]|uniref:Uncharacterized protein n=1 Tax=Eubacterium barkeri TaxID=1528 RepID=A0A1H3IS51_EUBBA|nr:hypothetical protein [Eubacterium barkeri]SDY30407.1 hypothetical protein SAMN04488579_12456 [Eubacterium barkeri]
MEEKSIYIPESILALYDELVSTVNDAVANGKHSIDLNTGAKLIGMDKECFRTAAYRGTNPYAVGGRQVSRNGNNESGFGRVPILPLYCRMTNITGEDLSRALIGGK